MIRKILSAGFVAAVLVAATPAGAQFMAADLLYIPGAAHQAGENETSWRSDLFITNVEEDADVDIAIVYLPTGRNSNASRFIDRSTWLGGREDEGFGYVDPLLADIPPQGTVVIRDAIGDYWGTEEGTATSGALVIFAYESNTLEDDGTRVLKNVIVNSRVYTRETYYKPDPDNEGEFLEVKGTFGQTLPAVPWYSLADPAATPDNGSNGNFSFLLLTGAAQNNNFRYNIGILNASDPLTTLDLSIQPFNGDGEPFLSDEGLEIIRAVSMPALSHIQYNNALSQLFGLANVPDDTIVKVSVLSWSSGNADPVVGITVYGTMIDNKTDDPTAILPAFAYPYNVECQWPTSGSSSKSTAGGTPRVRTRPLEIPSL